MGPGDSLGAQRWGLGGDGGNPGGQPGRDRGRKEPTWRGGGEGDGRERLGGFSAGSSRQLPGGEGAEGPSSYQGALGHAASVTAPGAHRPQQEASLRALPLCCDCGQGPARPGPLHPGAAHLPSHGALAHTGPRGCTHRGCPPTPRHAASGLGEPLASVRPHPLQPQGGPHTSRSTASSLGKPPPGSPHPCSLGERAPQPPFPHTGSVCNRHISFLKRMHVFPVGFTNNFKFYCFLSLMNSQKHVTSSPVMNVERQAGRTQFARLN